MKSGGSTCFLVLAMILSFVSGCAGPASRSGGGSGVADAYDDPLTWLQAARRHEAAGDLQRALTEYRLAKTVGGDEELLQADLRRLQRRIEERCAGLLKKAERAAAKGRSRAARNLYLEILGLQPDHGEALAALRKQDQKLALQGLEKKQALARGASRNGKSREKPKAKYEDEGYAYSRQAILEAKAQRTDAQALVQELRRHLVKYPQDREMRRLLIETSLARAKQAFQSGAMDDALAYLSGAEQATLKEEGRQSVLKLRRTYARELYKQGVITFRNEPGKALEHWRYALRFDPQDEKSRLRIRSMQQAGTSEN